MEKSPQNTPDSEQERCELSVPETSQRKTHYVGWDMVNRILKRLIIPAILVAVFSAQSVGDELKSPLERHARINTQSADYDRDVGLGEESALPAWLEDLLTRLPEEVVAESPQAEDPASGKPPEGIGIHCINDSGCRAGRDESPLSQAF